MYNRYIPQPDGSYCRRPMSEPQQPVHNHSKPQWQPAPPPCESKPEPPAPPCPPPQKPRPNNRCGRRPPPPPPKPAQKENCRDQNGSVTDFLRQLLPKDFDTGDLLIVLLLLLMSGDCQEDQNTALLTLALYLFM